MTNTQKTLQFLIENWFQIGLLALGLLSIATVQREITLQETYATIHCQDNGTQFQDCTHWYADLYKKVFPGLANL